jgi:hypothetical protein
LRFPSSFEIKSLEFCFSRVLFTRSRRLLKLS